MATDLEITQVRQMGDVSEQDFSDDELGIIIDRESTIHGAIAEIWEIKSGRYAELVNISEAGSSRSLGDLSTKALALSKYYRGLDVSPTPTTTGRTIIGVIQRA